MVHIASISAEEVIWTEGKEVKPSRRLWLTSNNHGPAQGMELLLERHCGGPGERGYTLRLLQTAKPGP